MPKLIRPEIKEDWITLHQLGVPCTKIAKVYKVRYGTVRNHLEECGVFKREVVEVTLKQVDEWIKLYKTGNETVSSIANKYNVSRNTISKYLTMFGIEIYRNGELVENEN